MDSRIEYIDRDHIFLRHPFTCVIAGPTGSGKSMLATEIIRKYCDITNFSKPQVNLIWIFAEEHSLSNVKFNANFTVKFITTIPENSEIERLRPDILVVDDLMTEFGDDKRLSLLFTRKSHHFKFSVIFLIQNIFYKCKEIRTVSLNAHYVILMKNRRDIKQIECFARQAFPTKVKEFIEAYMKATEKPYSYLLIDFRQETLDKYRLRDNITNKYCIGLYY